MTTAGLRPWHPVIGDWSAEFGYAAGTRIAADQSVTAVFAANDQIAIGLLSALDQADQRVPDDISIIGFDNQPESAYLIPPLTTVQQDFAEVGRRAVDALILAISGSPPPDQDLIAPHLVVRSSTAAPRPSD
jgi:DNA-binding LacI/PurR family transcriptional regulator